MFKDPLYRDVAKYSAIILAVGILCHFTNGYAIALPCAVGLWAAIRGRLGLTLAVFAIVPLLSMINPLLIPKAAHFSKITRLSMLAITLLLIAGRRQSASREKLPLAAITFYLLGAVVSSFHGWMPLLSYLKIINFAAFVAGIYIASKGIDRRREDLDIARKCFFSISALMVYGSIAALPFPAIAYYTTLRGVIAEDGAAYADEFYYSYEGISLFTGITVQSQFLGPLLALIFAYVVCDMLFLEKKIRPLHMLIVLPIPILLYMTRARVGILAFVVFLACALFYSVPKASLDFKTKNHLKNLLVLVVILLFAGAYKAERETHAISRLLRKTDTVTYDSRSIVAAATESRMGLVSQSMDDFRLNPLFGMGFQVAENHKYMAMYDMLSFFSAPIEKGLLPTMVLGETGIFGAILFLYFLCDFFGKCRKRRYVVTSTLMVVFLATNMAEATFFSPGGGGGVFWLYTAIGGFCIDMLALNESRAALRIKTGLLRNFARAQDGRTRIPFVGRLVSKRRTGGYTRITM